jgi:TPR repeat protein
MTQNIAATQDHPDACFALTAWYLVGSPGVLPQSDTEAYLWAKKAAESGLAKAQYAVGYFTEVGHFCSKVDIGVAAVVHDGRMVQWSHM